MDNGGPVGIRSFLHSDPLAWDVVRSSFSSAACSGTVSTLSYTSLARAVCLLLVCWNFLLPRKASWSLRNWPQPFYVLCASGLLDWSFAEAIYTRITSVQQDLTKASSEEVAMPLQIR